jgi:hypothetical protein
MPKIQMTETGRKKIVGSFGNFNLGLVSDFEFRAKSCRAYQHGVWVPNSRKPG